MITIFYLWKLPIKSSLQRMDGPELDELPFRQDRIIRNGSHPRTDDNEIFACVPALLIPVGLAVQGPSQSYQTSEREELPVVECCVVYNLDLDVWSWMTRNQKDCW